MGAILEQLGVNQTFFIQLGLFVGVFLLMKVIFFKPFLHLFELRHKKTVEDRVEAEKLLKEAAEKLEEYKKILSAEKAEAVKKFEAVVAEVKKQEAEILSQAREEAKKTTQTVVDSLAQQKAQLQKELEFEVESLAQKISETLLVRK